MRILHVLPQFPYFGGTRIVGGYPSTVLNLVERQQGMHQVEIMSRTFPTTPPETCAGSTIHPLGDARRAGTPLRTAWFMIRAALAVARRRGDFDIVHLHAGYVDYLLLAALLRLAGGRTTAATIYCPASPTPSRRRLQRMIIGTCHRIVRVSGMSENVASSIRELVPAALCVRTPPVLDAKIWGGDQPGDFASNATGRIGEPLRVLFVGNASPTKGLDILFTAAAKARASGLDLLLTVTTELDRTSPDSRIADLRQFASDLGLEDHVRYLGIVDDMRELVRSNDVHVAPFRSTQGPSDYFVSTLEAMAAGKCVIASRLDGMTEIVVHGHNGLLSEPGNPEDLAAQLISASDEATRRRLAAAAGQTMRSGDMTPATNLARFEELYDTAKAGR